jgi:hypothetical protein
LLIRLIFLTFVSYICKIHLSLTRIWTGLVTQNSVNASNWSVASTVTGNDPWFGIRNEIERVCCDVTRCSYYCFLDSNVQAEEHIKAC